MSSGRTDEKVGVYVCVSKCLCVPGGSLGGENELGRERGRGAPVGTSWDALAGLLSADWLGRRGGVRGDGEALMGRVLAGATSIPVIASRDRERRQWTDNQPTSERRSSAKLQP
jgi:hypothetical protein